MKENILYSRTLNLRTRVSDTGSSAGDPRRGVSQPSVGGFRLVVATLVAAISAFEIQNASADQCLAREGSTSIIDRESRSRYEAKLYVSPDEVARYVFLTNAWYDGDHSAAIYRVPRKKGSLPGDYWITATVAAESTRGRRRNVSVRRYDAPLPESVANVLHELWVTTVEQTPVDEDAIPEAPTGIFSATTSKGVRLRAVTVSLHEQDSICGAMMDVGESLIKYAKLPASRRVEAARQIEQEIQRLLKRVLHKR